MDEDPYKHGANEVYVEVNGELVTISRESTTIVSVVGFSELDSIVTIDPAEGSFSMITNCDVESFAALRRQLLANNFEFMELDHETYLNFLDSMGVRTEKSIGNTDSSSAGELTIEQRLQAMERENNLYDLFPEETQFLKAADEFNEWLATRDDTSPQSESQYDEDEFDSQLEELRQKFRELVESFDEPLRSVRSSAEGDYPHTSLINKNIAGYFIEKMTQDLKARFERVNATTAKDDFARFISTWNIPKSVGQQFKLSYVDGLKNDLVDFYQVLVEDSVSVVLGQE